jgi:hypothetical protein
MPAGYLAAGALAAVLLHAGGAWSAAGDMTVAVAVRDSEIAVRTCARFAGAVCSITYRGKEHIDTRDHGRLLQSASFFDRYDECLNPTEGGAERDRFSSTSVLKSALAEGNRIWTVTDMAYWLRPNQDYPKGCGRRTGVKRAINSVAISGHLLEKQLVVGLPDFHNVIEHRVTYYVPTAFSHGVFEASTGYMPKDFSLHLYFDPVSSAEYNPGTRQGEQAYPVILATPDRRHAMGVYSSELPQGKHGYGRFTFPDVVKWNCVFRENEVKPGPRSYRCLVILGTVEEVQDTIRRLHADREAGQPRGKPGQIRTE